MIRHALAALALSAIAGTAVADPPTVALAGAPVALDDGALDEVAGGLGIAVAVATSGASAIGLVNFSGTSTVTIAASGPLASGAFSSSGAVAVSLP